MCNHRTSILLHDIVRIVRRTLSLHLYAALSVTAVMAQSSVIQFSIPGDIGWEEAQQPPFSPGNYFPEIDYALSASGIAPLDTTVVIEVPILSTAAAIDELSPQELDRLSRFTGHIARDHVIAQRDFIVDGDTLAHAGQVLLEAGADLPRSLAGIRLFTGAGVDSVRTMVNLAHAVLWPRNPQFRFESLLWSPTQYETQLNDQQLRSNLEHLIDVDASTAFVREDAPNRVVEKRSVVIRMDLVSRFPVGLVRFYPRPRDLPLAISGYSIEINDGINLKPTLTGTLSPVNNAAYELLGDEALAQKGVPLYDMLRIERGNDADTVAIALDPPQYLRFLQFKSLTALDFDVAELEVFGRGFVPQATYVTRALPFQSEAASAMLEYQAGNRARRAQLDALPGATLGRVFWDERTIGDPAHSSASISMRTGTTPEPLLLFRVNGNGDAVEWRADTQVIDHRDGSPTEGTSVWLDDPLLRTGSRAVWEVLPAEVRAGAQTTFAEYMQLPAARRERNGSALPRVRDPVWWSPFQPLTNGQVISARGGRPFFQLRVDFTSSDPDAATIVENLHFELVVPPVVSRLQAEVVPAAGINPAVDTLFTYALQLHAEVEDAGVNRIRVGTPAFSQVRGVELVLELDEEGVSTRPLSFDTATVEPGFFVVAIPELPAITRASTEDTRLLIHFRTRVLGTTTFFESQAFLDTLDPSLERSYGDIVVVGSETRILPQRVRAGNAIDFGADRRDRNSLSAITAAHAPVGDLVARVTLQPNPFTPNGDGINDRVHIGYDLLRVLREVDVEAGIFDLSGRRLRGWQRRVPPGEVADGWDGKDDQGDLVPPGIYLLQLRVRTDAADFRIARHVALAY